MIKKGFKTFHLPIFGNDIAISIGQTNDEFLVDFQETSGYTVEKITGDFHEISFADSCSGMVVQAKAGNVAVRVHWNADDAFGFGVLMHEVLHAVCRALEHRGVTFHESSEETFAYVQGWLCQQLFDWFMESVMIVPRPAPDPLADALAELETEEEPEHEPELA